MKTIQKLKVNAAYGKTRRADLADWKQMAIGVVLCLISALFFAWLSHGAPPHWPWAVP